MTIRITSTQNPRIRQVLLLSKTRNRKKENLFIIEGIREISKAANAGYHFTATFFCPELLEDDSKKILDKLSPETELYEVTRHVYEKIAYRDNRDGVIIEAVPKYPEPEELILSENPLLLVLETIEKPGNIGAIFRTADAVKVDAVLVCDNNTDIYHPNIIRSSLGCLFTTQFSLCTPAEALHFLRSKGIRIISSALQTEVLYTDTDLTKPTALILGSEAEGLTEIWRRHSDAMVKIPMSGVADSLNVSVTAGIMVYEAWRQRYYSRVRNK